MFDLFKNELQRFGKIAVLFCIILTGYWLYQSLFTPIVQSSKAQLFFLNIFVFFCGIVLGLIQMGLHRRKTYWTHLVHRPVDVKKIHLSLSAASAVMLFVGLILPLIVVMIGYDLTSNLVIESRHYLRPAQLYIFALIGYFIASFIVLAPHKIAVMSLSWIILCASSRDIVSNELLFAVSLLSLVITFTLARLSFKVNLSEQLSKKPQVLFTALMLQPGLAAALYFSQMVHYHLPVMLVDNHPDQYTIEQQEGYFSQIWRLSPQQIIEKFVDDSYQQKQQLAKRSEHVKAQWLSTRFTPKPIVGQMHTYDKQYSLRDDFNDTFWVFSHDLGVLVGTHQTTDQQMGYLGKNGFLESTVTLSESDRFNGVPYLIDNQFIQTDNKIYVVDFEQQQLELKHQLAADQSYSSLAARQPEGDFYIVASNRNLYLFEPSNFEEANDYSAASYIIEHPFPFDSSLTIRYSDLIDGYLFDYRSSDLFGFGRPGIALVFIDHDGNSSIVTKHEFNGYRPLPNWVTEQHYWFSPIVIGTLYPHLNGLLRPSSPEDVLPLSESFEQHYPASIYYLALFSAVFSALVTFLLARRIKLSTSNTIMWSVFNLICALPGLLAFLFMTSWREALYAAKQ